MLDGFGPAQLGIVLVVFLLFFGNRVPEMMRGLGSGLKEFKKAVHEEPSEGMKERATEEKREV
jgi:sec-independent protein translocase protein TatA